MEKEKQNADEKQSPFEALLLLIYLVGGMCYFFYSLQHHASLLS